jgi:flagellar basal body-associated protein FliL
MACQGEKDARQSGNRNLLQDQEQERLMGSREKKKEDRDFILQIVWGIFVACAIMLVLVFVLAGCKNTANPQPSPTPNSQPNA